MRVLFVAVEGGRGRACFIFLLFGRGACFMFCCLGGGVFYVLLFGRGACFICCCSGGGQKPDFWERSGDGG